MEAALKNRGEVQHHADRDRGGADPERRGVVERDPDMGRPARS
jgi:hypothetical protein